MKSSKRLWALAVIVCAANAWGDGPHAGYLYPAGGQQGAIIEVVAGGQFLNGVNNVFVSGEGVHASVVQYGKPFNNQEVQDLRKQINEMLKERRAAESGKGLTSVVAQGEALVRSVIEPLPDHPLLRHVTDMSLKELEYWFNMYFNSGKKQQNAQLGETVIIQVTIDSGAAPGDRILRLGTPNGLTNPLRFQVGPLPEVLEQEPNDQQPSNATPLELPVLLNGQIMPGDVDRFRFRAQQGQHLVVQAQARRLMPYLADAVPGWFQATLALYDEKGHELAFDDDYRFDPDPVLFYEVPEAGEYTLEIRDSIYRGREDFVYRVSVGELPFITGMFPLGGRAGEKTVAEIAGWNLHQETLQLDLQPGGDCLRLMTLQQNSYLSNTVPYAVDALPESLERKKNDNVHHAQRVKLPQIVNGRIERPGDVDVFKFKGRADDDVVAEVYARRLNSPLDSVLRIMDASGKVLAWNDDPADNEAANKESGLLTHHADSYVRVKLPKDGKYYVSVSDAQQQGGPEFAYRLRLSAPQPDFALRVTPSGVNLPAGRVVPISVYAQRKDGFDGDIQIELKDAPPGLKLTGGRIPGGRSSVRMTLTAPPKPLDQPVTLQFEGCAEIAGQAVHRPVVPAEDMMQAFAYRHLTPSQNLMAAVTGAKRGAANVERSGETPLKIPAGGEVEVSIKVPKAPKQLDQVELELSDPPKGISLPRVAADGEGLTFTLKTDGAAVKAGYADNLIVEAFYTPPAQPQQGKKAPQKQRVSLGVLPAIPFEIVAQ